MIDEQDVDTERGVQHVHHRPDDGPVVLALHDNLCDGRVWHAQLAALPRGVVGLAVDLAGFGRASPRPLAAATALDDWAADVVAAADAVAGAARPLHLVGHGLGAGVAWRLATAHPERVASIVLVAPVSPYGLGGTRRDGSPYAEDFAGSGAGCANPVFVQRIAEGDRGADSDASPRSVVRSMFFPRSDAVRDEDDLVEAMLATRVGDDHYPGERVASTTWPYVAPGERGVLNALSPRFCDLTDVADAGLAVPITWIRGERDAIVADRSKADLAFLGKLELVPDWPGEGVAPPQPMVAQTRDLLGRLAGGGCTVDEQAWSRTGHVPFAQHPDRFASALAAHLEGAGPGS